MATKEVRFDESSGEISGTANADKTESRLGKKHTLEEDDADNYDMMKDDDIEGKMVMTNMNPIYVSISCHINEKTVKSLLSPNSLRMQDVYCTRLAPGCVWQVEEYYCQVESPDANSLTANYLVYSSGYCCRWHSQDALADSLFVLWKIALFLVIRWASAKLENSFVTANFASARAQLSKLERQRALLQNCGQIMNKQQLFIFPNSLTIHQTPPLHNTFYFNNTWKKIQLRSDPVNNLMKLNATLKDPLQHYGLLPARCWVHLAEAPLRTVGHYHYTWRGTAGFEGSCRVLECHISHHKAASTVLMFSGQYLT